MVFGMVYADVFKGRWIRIFIDSHKILGMARCMYNIGLVDLVSDFEKDT